MMKTMKGICCFLAGLALLCSCGGGKQVEGLNGRVTLEGYEGRKVYLEATDGTVLRKDSAVVENGRFTIALNDSMPQVYRLVLGTSDKDIFPITLPVVSEKGYIQVSMGELVLTSGTPLNDLMQDFLLAVSNFGDKVMQQKDADMTQLKEDFAKLVEESVMQNIANPVGVYIYRHYAEKLSDAQKQLILSRADESFKQAVK